MPGLRVVIIGGGLSGLISLIEAHSKGVNVDLIEQSGRLGGQERKFKIDLSSENAAFFQKFGVDTATLTTENAYSTLVEKTLTYLHAQHVKEVRAILFTEATAILTDSEHKKALGVHFKRHLQSPDGKSLPTEANIFGDALIFATNSAILKNLLTSNFSKVEEGKIILSQGELGDSFVSKGEKMEVCSLNAFTEIARNAANRACELQPKIDSSKGIRQPLPFIDKVGTYHGVALKPSEWVPLKLDIRIQLNKFNHLFRFALPEKNQQVGLFCGQYISIRAVVEGKDVIRYYSPVSRNSDYGFLDLMIKIEENTTNKPMEKFLSELKVGDVIEFKGPMGGFEYHRNMYREVGMIAGGTGITPMVQIIRSVANHPEDDTKVKLLYGNYNEEDILCRDELSYYTLTRTNISVHISLVNAPGKWSMSTGFINEDMIRKTLPPPANDIVILLCGPPPMIKGMIAMLKTMGYTDQMIFSFV